MKGKYAKKESRKTKGGVAVIIALVCAAVLIALLTVAFGGEDKNPGQAPVLDTTPAEQDQPVTEQPAETEKKHTPPAVSDLQDAQQLGDGVVITDLLSYTGAFMEDRTDEVVTDVLAIQVTNAGEEYIQTMDITLTADQTQAEFSLSSLFPGETVVVLEKNRMAYSTAPAFDQVQTSAVALFEGHPGMCQDQLEIQCLDGVINVTNISGKDIPGDVLIYYKNYVSGMYYGGITYRLRLEGGMKAGEIRQGMAAHFHPNNSAIVFVTCG